MSNPIAFSIMVACFLGCIALGIHIKNHTVLTKASKIWFLAGAGILAVVTLVEAICSINSLAVTCKGLYLGLILIEVVISPFLCGAKCYACGIRKMGRIAIIIGIVLAICNVVAFFTGHLFTIDDAGNYTAGSWAWVNMVATGIMAVYSLVMLLVLSKTFQNRDFGTLVAIVILIVAGEFFVVLTGLECIGYLFSTLNYYLLFNYYTSLCGQTLQEEILERNRQIEEFVFQTMQSLAGAIDAKDKYTNGHSRRVAEYSASLARKAGWNDEELKKLQFAALMHDIGKIGIPDSVLNKNGRLNDIEFGLMKAHTSLGSEIAERITQIPEIYYASRSHHERYDGKGYPDGLAGKDIPEISRIIAIADTFDAMNSDRIYRKALSKEIIRQELIKGSETQFDPDFLKLFLELFDAGELDSIGAEGRKDMSFDSIPESFVQEYKDFVALCESEFGAETEGEPCGADNILEVEASEDKLLLIKDEVEKIDPKARLVRFIISASAGRELSDFQLKDAVMVIENAAASKAKSDDAYVRVSGNEILFMYIETENAGIKKCVEDILLHFYKTTESELYDLRVEVIE